MADPRPPVRFGADVSNLAFLDPILAHLLGWISYYAYYDSAPAWYGQIIGASNLLRIPADEATGRPQGWCMTLDECNVVAFGGTTDYSQLYGTLRDTYFATVMNTYPTIVVGSAWGKHVRDILASFQTPLLDRMTFKKTIFTGHSLGGAIAATLCWALQAVGGGGLLPSTAVSFGSPKVGNRNFSSAAGAFFNVIRSGDIVPKLPPFGYVRPLLSNDTYLRSVWPNDGFTFHGKVTYLNDNGGLEVLDPGAALRPADIGVEWDAARVFGDAFFSGVRWKNPAKLAARSFADSVGVHCMTDYLGCLEKNIPKVPDEDGESLIKEAVFMEDKLPAEPLTTIPSIVPPAFPTPPLTAGVRPLTGRRRH